jgi:lipopolysaccharide heptosyltransferase I
VTPQRVLLVRLSAVGDCVHALPAVQALRAALPEAHLAWAIDDRSAALLEGLKDVNEFLVMPRRALRGLSRVARWRRLAGYRREVRDAKFDVAVDMQGLTKSALLAFFSRAGTRIGYSRADGARELAPLFYNTTPPVPRSARHVGEKSRALLAPLGVDLEVPLPHPQIPHHAGAAARVKTALADMSVEPGSFAVLNPGAGWITKLWPLEHFAALAAGIRAQLDLEVLVTWFGPEEKQMAEVISADGNARPAPQTDLQELAELLRFAALYVGSDTGPTHIAAAGGTATVALFGAADPERNHPLGPRVRTLTAGLECSPCWQRAQCPRDLECMRSISPAQVLAAAESLEVRR